MTTFRHARLGVVALIAVLAGVSAPRAANAVTRSQTATLPFEQCVGNIESLTIQFGIMPIKVLDLPDIKIARFITPDGFVLVTCSKADQQMSVTQSSDKLAPDPVAPTEQAIPKNRGDP